MGPSNYYCFEGPRGTGIGKASERIDRNRSRHERPAPKNRTNAISHVNVGKSIATYPCDFTINEWHPKI